MDLTAFAEALYQSAFSEWIRGSLKALPIIESVHVMAVATVFGTVAIVDLRLIGWLDKTRPFRQVFAETLRCTWVGFVVAVITGVLLFVPNARTYVVNTAFGLKLVALALVGINATVFQFVTLPAVSKLEPGQPMPLGARIAGITSILLWTSVIVFGRVIGFTKGYDFSVPKDMDFEF